MIAITVLRVLVGWHFLYEGLTKLTAPVVVGGRLPEAGQGAVRGAVPLARRVAQHAGQRRPDHDVGADAGRRLPDPRPVHAAREPRPASRFLLMFYLAAPPWIGYFYSVPSEGSYLIVNKNLVEAARPRRHLLHRQRAVRRARSHRPRPARTQAPPRDGVIGGFSRATGQAFRLTRAGPDAVPDRNVRPGLDSKRSRFMTLSHARDEVAHELFLGSSQA